MASFDPAHEKTLGHELFPGYANDPHDRGGETIAGVSRVSWAKEAALLWTICDETKLRLKYDNATLQKSKIARQAMDRQLGKDPRVRALVKVFYRDYVWAKLGLDAEPDQKYAEKLYDHAVLRGDWRAKDFDRQVREAVG
jgi:lysozyme family protein